MPMAYLQTHECHMCSSGQGSLWLICRLTSVTCVAVDKEAYGLSADSRVSDV